MSEIKVGIIGGTGMTQLNLFKKTTEKTVETPYGSPSSSLICGKMNEVDCVLLSRHGRPHNISPTNVNYRANIFALHQEGCNIILATTACGSLVEDAKPGSFVIVDQFIDRTNKREATFYDGKPNSLKGVCHIPCKNSFDAALRDLLSQACTSVPDVKFQNGGTVVTIEGPRFSSYAESILFKSWGATVINMTLVPEVVLANELGLPYASIAMVTDYDCWKNEISVSVDEVMKTMKGNSIKATNVLVSALALIKERQKIILKSIESCKKIAASSVM